MSAPDFVKWTRDRNVDVLVGENGRAGPVWGYTQELIQVHTIRCMHTKMHKFCCGYSILFSFGDAVSVGVRRSAMLIGRSMVQKIICCCTCAGYGVVRIHDCLVNTRVIYHVPLRYVFCSSAALRWGVLRKNTPNFVFAGRARDSCDRTMQTLWTTIR